jgi:uncharacterized membrane protein
MIPFITAYGVAFVVFFTIDLVWLGKISKKLYRKEIGSLLLERPNWGAGILFYFIYLIGIVVFAILPANSWFESLGYGAFFGFIAYATYDMTNLATMKNWSSKITVIDLGWGSFISGVTAMLSFLILSII